MATSHTQATGVVRTVADLRAQVTRWRHAGDTIALVPTMGALHAGHVSLIGLARQHADKVVASIFVNPSQFGPAEDFARYPRDASGDLAKLTQAGCDLVYTPDVADIYPPGFATTVHVEGISDILCGAFRPGHFDGVAIVVAKLLLQAVADVAIFGEKDFQQLHVIRRMVADLNIPSQIIGAPILREADGLAMSSRNAYLTLEERQIARTLPEALSAGVAALGTGADVAGVCAAITAQLLAAGFSQVDYVSLCADADLAVLTRLIAPARLLVAARLGKTRLIDNMAVDLTGPQSGQ